MYPVSLNCSDAGLGPLARSFLLQPVAQPSVSSAKRRQGIARATGRTSAKWPVSLFFYYKKVSLFFFYFFPTIRKKIVFTYENNYIYVVIAKKKNKVGRPHYLALPGASPLTVLSTKTTSVFFLSVHATYSIQFVPAQCTEPHLKTVWDSIDW